MEGRPANRRAISRSTRGLFLHQFLHQEFKLNRPGEKIALECAQSPFGNPYGVLRLIYANPPSAQLLGGDQGSARSAEAIQHQVAGIRGCRYDELEKV